MAGWRQRRGQQGEQLARAYLERQGYRIQEHNYRHRRGEIDIIAWDGATLVFVEVKTKGQEAFGYPQEMVDQRKQQTLVYGAMAYVQKHRIRHTALRFDVIAIRVLPAGPPEVTHIPGAFSPTDYFCY
jgi:putative endonuclease